MSPHAKRYTIHMTAAMIAYMAVLFGAVWVLEHNELAAPLRAALALAPVLPALYALHAVLTFYRAMDEFQRRIQAEAWMLSGLLVGFVSFSYGFLEGVLDLPVIPMIWVLPALIGTWGVCAAFLRWRLS